MGATLLDPSQPTQAEIEEGQILMAKVNLARLIAVAAVPNFYGGTSAEHESTLLADFSVLTAEKIIEYYRPRPQ